MYGFEFQMLLNKTLSSVSNKKTQENSIRRVSKADGGGWRPYVLRKVIASRVEPRADKGLQA